MRFLTLLVISVLLINCSGRDDLAISESDKFLAQHQYDNARAVIEKALREDPKNVKLLRQQVRYFLSTEQVAFSLAANGKLLEAAPGSQTLYQSLSDPNPVVRITAVRAFGELKNADSLPALIKAANDQDKSVRQAVIQSLVKLEDKNTLPTLQKLLQDNDWFIRGNAALALGKIGDAASVAQLFKALTDPDNYVRKSAQLSLWQLATPKTQPAQTPNEKKSPELESAYLQALDSTEPAIRTTAALILAANGNPAATPKLLAELNNPANPALPEIIRALAKIKDPAALPGLHQLLNNANDEIKIAAILALGNYQDQSSADALKNLLKDPKSSHEVKTACTVTLNKLGKK